MTSTTLHKIYGAILAVVLIAMGLLFVAWLRSHDAHLRMEGDIRVRDEHIAGNTATVKANNVTAQIAQATRDNALTNNSQLDAALSKALAPIRNQMATLPTTAQTQEMIQAAIPGVKVTQGKDAQGNATLEVQDTPENRAAINKADTDFKTCQFSLDTCALKQRNFEIALQADQTQINALKGNIDALNGTIKAQGDTIKEQGRFGKGGNFWARTGRVYIPLGCAAAGGFLGASRSTKGAAIGALAAGVTCSLPFHF